MAVAHAIRTVGPTLFWWQAYEPSVKCNLSSCAISTNEGLVFVDPIALEERALAALESRFKPCAVILTSGNHCRDSATYAQKFRVPIYAHVDSSESTGLMPAATLADGDIAPGGLRVVTIEGAGPGEIALVGNGVACLGDAVINLPPEGLRLLPAKYCKDPQRLPISLRKLLSYDFDIMTLAHGEPIVIPPHSPTPVPVLTVSGAAGAKAISSDGSRSTTWHAHRCRA